MREFREIIHHADFVSSLYPSVCALCMRGRVKLRLLFIFLAHSLVFFFCSRGTGWDTGVCSVSLDRWKDAITKPG